MTFQKIRELARIEAEMDGASVRTGDAIKRLGAMGGKLGSIDHPEGGIHTKEQVPLVAEVLGEFARQLDVITENGQVSAAACRRYVAALKEAYEL
jgi:hypothetical protein